MDKIYVVGHPSPVGGADTELGHQIRVWQALDLQVHIIPTAALDETHKAMQMEQLGCIIHAPKEWSACKGAHVIAYCNGDYLTNLSDIKQFAKSTIWVNCMTWLFDNEKKAHEDGLIDHFVYQTDHAREKVQQGLIDINPRYIWHKVRPYFHACEFPFVEHRSQDVFKFGRISREDADKFHAAQFWVYENMVSPVAKAGLVLGMNDAIREKCGGTGWREPNWIDCYPAGAMKAQELYKHATCIIQMCDTYENLPRVAFEAMSSGSLLVVDDRGGWREQIQHGQTGFLCRNQREFVYYSSRAAFEQAERQLMIQNAHDWLSANWGMENAKEEWTKFFNEIESTPASTTEPQPANLSAIPTRRVSV